MAEITPATQQAINDRITPQGESTTTPTELFQPISASTSGLTAPTAPDTSTISSGSLSPVTPIPFVAPNPTPIPSVSSLQTVSTPALTETPEEKAASDESATIEGLNNSMVGKSAYQAQQDTAAGVDTLTQQQRDLSTQVTQLKNEALAIPNQLQLDATGRGITANGLAPIQTAALRNNSIKALSVSSLLDATNGLLASAQDKANKAVAAKYDPIQEQIDAATANLKLILADPQTSIDDKNRAQAQLDAQKTQQNQLDTAKQNAADVLSASISAAKNGADAATLQKMQAAPDGQTALQIAAAAGYGTSDVNDLITKYPDAGIQSGDTLQQAQQKVLQSPTYTLAEKSAMLDIKTKEQALNNAGNGGTVGISNPDGSTTNVPADVAPYYNTSSSGVGYVDASTLEGTAAQKTQIIKQATAAGLKVITNKNEAADLTNIQDANSKLDTIGTIMAGLDSPSVLARGLNNLGLTQLATLTQSDPQKAASGALQAVGLDILKAISGVQGFRGNATVVQQINEHMPTIYDTSETAAQKIDYIRQLISDRENSILGTSSSTGSYNGVTLPGTGGSSTYNGITLPN